VEQSIEVVELVRDHFPHLQIVARARDVPHWNRLRELGVERVERELFESSLRSARSVLELTGLSPHTARQTAMRFRRHNLELLDSLRPHFGDRARLIAAQRAGREQLEQQMAQERAQRAQHRPKGWDDNAGR
jgi:glutathione-regulated potassium-efflux system ancillary protein KefC